MTGWRRYWLLGAILYLPYVVSTAAGEWPTQEQVRRQWEEERQISEQGGRTFGNIRYRKRSEDIDRSYTENLRALNKRQDAVIGWAFVNTTLSG